MKVFLVLTSLLGIVYCDNGSPHQASKDEEVPQLRAPAPAPVSLQPIQVRPLRPIATFSESVGERPSLHFVSGPQPATLVGLNRPVVFPGDVAQGPIFRPNKFSKPFSPSEGFSPSSFVPVHQVSGPVAGSVFVPQRPISLPAKIPLVPHQTVNEVHHSAPIHSTTVLHDEPLLPVAAHPTVVPVRPLRPPVLLQQTPFVNFQESDNRQPLIPISSPAVYHPQPEISLPYPITQNPTTNPHYVAPRPPKYTPVPAPIDVPPRPAGDFQFGYDVDFDDKYGGAKYSHNENHNGQAITGKYHVNLPGGSFQSVSYTSQH